MKVLRENDIGRNLASSIDGRFAKYIDKEKLSLYIKDVPLGIKNYILFQKFFNFRWPFWLFNKFSIESRNFSPVTPFLLLNSNNRNGIYFSNPESSGQAFIDPSGMISPCNDPWSVEFWLLEKDTLFRPQEKISEVTLCRDLDTSLINVKWKEINFEFKENIYGIGSSEEIVCELDTILQKSNIPVYLFIAVRPYNTFSLSGIDSIEYDNKKKLIRINNYDRIIIENKPDYILTGNASGDIDFSLKNKKDNNITCGSSMATIALGFRLSRGNNENIIRISLHDNKNISPRKLNFTQIKKEYTDKIISRSGKGFKLIFPDRNLQNWISGIKIAACSFYNAVSAGINSGRPDFRSLYYIISGYNRLGFFSESAGMLDSISSKIDAGRKLTFNDILNRCYYIASVSDYFNLSRDIEYIKSKYQFLRKLAAPVIQYSGSLNGKRRNNNNSIRNYFVAGYHICDMILLAHALNEFSYMARCLGIFNDEVKFNKEYLRLEGIIINEMNPVPVIPEDVSNERDDSEDKEESDVPGNVLSKNEFFAYNILAGYPFRIGLLTIDKLKKIAEDISASFGEYPLYFKTAGGSDNIFSIIYAINLLIIKDKKAYGIIEKLMEFGKGRYSFPDIVNPKTGCGIYGDGDSSAVLLLFFVLLRSAMFMDSHEGLELFPIPEDDWFLEGSEIRIENAPSVFGMVDLKVISTKNEVQIYFLELPKYVPPQIIINLPFPAKIKHGDDFIIKKETGNSFVIHGWPSVIRFIKK